MDVIAALADALGAFDAKHVELAFDVAEDEIGPRHWSRAARQRGTAVDNWDVLGVVGLLLMCLALLLLAAWNVWQILQYNVPA
jgi:hypothetical protein